MSRSRPVSHSEEYKKAVGFVLHYCGPKWIAPFGGNDRFAFEGFCSAVALWGRGDVDTQANALPVLRGLVAAMQEHNRHTAYLAIIALLDWGIAGRLIPQIVPQGDTTSVLKYIEALATRGDQHRTGLELGPLQLHRKHAPLLKLELWPGAPLLDLSKASDRAQLARLDPQELAEKGWDQFTAIHWWHALSSLADSHAEMWREDEARGEKPWLKEALRPASA